AEIAERLGPRRPGLPFAVASKVVLDAGKLPRADRELGLGFCIPEIEAGRQKQQIVVDIEEIEADASIRVRLGTEAHPPLSVAGHPSPARRSDDLSDGSSRS